MKHKDPWDGALQRNVHASLVILQPRAIPNELHLQKQMGIHIGKWTEFISASDIVCYEEPFSSSAYWINTKFLGVCTGTKLV